MVQLTDEAAVRLKSALSRVAPNEDACFRLGATEEGMKIVVDQQRAGDATVEYGGEVLIVIDAASAARCEERTIAFDEVAKKLVMK